MASDFETNDHDIDISNLPTPGAMRWGHDWVPTLDGERVSIRHPYWFERREEAWAEAIKWVKLRAGLAIEVELGSASGCLVDEWTVIVETVAEARQVILSHVLPDTKGPEHGSETHGPASRPHRSWEDLTGHEDSRRYDPGNPAAGMCCSYSLSETEWMEGAGGIRWPVTDHRWATGPPEIWDHPADQPAGLDADDHRGDNLQADVGDE